MDSGTAASSTTSTTPVTTKNNSRRLDQTPTCQTKITARACKRPSEVLSPTGFTPQAKITLVVSIADFLKTHFMVRVGKELSREEVFCKVQEFNPQVTPAVIARAMTKAFGQTVKRTGKSRDRFVNLYWLDKENVHDTLENASTRERTVSMKLSPKEAVLIAQLRNEEVNVAELCKAYPYLTSNMVEFVCNLLKKEVQLYASMPRSMLREATAEDMESFTIQGCWEEFQVVVPNLTAIISSVCIRKDQANLTLKTLQSIIPAVTSIIAKCLGVYSKRLSAWRTFYGLLLTSGGAKDSCIDRLACLYDTVKCCTLLPKLNDLAGRYELELIKWKRTDTNFCIVMDNVDKYVKPRQHSCSNKNKIVHMVQAIAVADRVRTDNYGWDPIIPLERVTAIDLLPTEADSEHVKTLMADTILQILAEQIPSLAWIVVTPREHEFTSYMKQKTSMVNLGVLLKNENDSEDMKDCLRSYNKHTKKASQTHHKLLVGDYLTLERVKAAQEAQADGKSSESRFEGFIAVMADFHVQMNLMNLIWKVLWSTDSGHAPGTLYCSRNFLDARNVTSEAASKYYDSTEFFEKVFKAYIVTAGLEEFNMKKLTDAYSGEISNSLARQAAVNIVTKFVNLELPDLNDSSNYKCPHCPRILKDYGKLNGHILKMHPACAETATDHDDVLGYSKTVITLGLLRHLHNSAIRQGNGAEIILLYKFFFVMFKAANLYKYGCGLLENVMQTYVLPQQLAMRMTWNRFGNTRGKPDSNIALDLLLEHENGKFKSELKSYRGHYTQSHIDRISQGRCQREKLIQSLDKEMGFWKHGIKDKREVSKMDIAKLVNVFSQANLLKEVAGRVHSPNLFNMTGNIMTHIKGGRLKDWMEERLVLAKSKHYYKQFNEHLVSSEMYCSDMEEIVWSSDEAECE